MRCASVTLFVLGLAFTPAVLAQSTADLPSAPSATQSSRAKQTQTQQQPSSPAPAQPSFPQSLATETQPAAAPPPPSPAPGKDAFAVVPDSSSEVREDESLPTITKRVDEVNVVFTVTDKRGRFIKDLTEKDFKVVDDHKPAKQVDWFSRQTNLPLRVGLLIDASNSIRDRFRFEQESASEFLAQTIRPRSDLAFVIGFDTTPEVTADFSYNTDELARGIRALRPGGGTALFDAVFYACRDKLMKAPHDGPVRRAVVLISDGEDNQSRVTREEAIEMAQRGEVIIYAISTNTSGVKLRGDKVMERMAEATGGRAFFPLKLQDVATAFTQIQDELRSQYAIAYKPADFSSDGRYHVIEILAENHKNFKIRARKGYFAPKQ